MRLEGIEEIEAALQSLQDFPGIVMALTVQDGLAAAARIVARELRRTRAFRDRTAERRAQQTPGQNQEGLRRRIRGGVGLIRYRPSGLVRFAPHAHLIDMGTVQRVTRRGYRRGRVRPTRFISRTVNRTADQAARAMVTTITREASKVNAEVARRRKVRQRTVTRFGADAVRFLRP